MTPRVLDKASPEGLQASRQTLRTFWRWIWFEFRAAGLRWRRSVRTWSEQAPTRTSDATRQWRVVVAESISPLWTSTKPEEYEFVAGKVQNLRVAASKLDGLVIGAGETFSFWKAVGPPRRSRGFVRGRELREGCMIATVGGGLCQLSNALHVAALEAGMEIVERHAHTKAVPGSIAAAGRDATVFWNYVDLRFRAESPFVIEARLSATHLIVRFRAEHAVRMKKEPHVSWLAQETADDCLTCHHLGCVYHSGVTAGTERTALLLDEFWPEFNAWLAAQSLTACDAAFVPLDGVRRGRASYAWRWRSHHRPLIREHPWLVLQRSWKLRRLRAQGAVRQRALLAFDRAFAQAYAARIPVECRHLVVSLRLLPHLAESGCLGGRNITVLLNRSPLFLLHQQLDRAAALYPHSTTIADFRAEEALVRRERDWLARADRLVTPHAWVGDQLRRLGFQRVEMLPWWPAESQPHLPGRKILFPASGLARKGACEVRNVCRELDLPLNVIGRAEENPGFWRGNDITFVQRGPDLFRNIACVVLPAHVEHQPRLLLAAAASGVPVICSPECGLSQSHSGVTIVPAGDEAALRASLVEITTSESHSCVTALK